jgi:hypothetical protein
MRLTGAGTWEIASTSVCAEEWVTAQANAHWRHPTHLSGRTTTVFMITSANSTEKVGFEALQMLELAGYGLVDLEGESAEGSW